MTTTDRRQGLRTGLGLKAPCVVASTAALTLSGEQTIDGIAVGSAQRVLVKDQSDLKENGIYDVGATAWARSRDFDGDGDAIPGTAVYVDRGTAGGGKFYAVNSSATSTSIVITTFVSSDADDKEWSLLSVALAGVSSFSQDTLFPLATAEAWRSSDGLSAAPDPFGSTSVSSSAIVTAGIADNAVTTAKIADNNVTLAKISTGTAGTLIAHSSTGQLGEVPVGSSGQLLISNGAGIPPTMGYGGLVQAVYAENVTFTSLTTVIPIDDTIPTSTEGTEILTATITPQDAANQVRVIVGGQFTVDVVSNAAIFTLFRDAGTSAVRSNYGLVGTANHSQNFSLIYVASAGSTLATTFKLRAGPNTGTMRINGQSGGRFFGGTLATTMIVEEVIP